MKWLVGLSALALSLGGCFDNTDLVAYFVANSTESPFIVRVGSGRHDGRDFVIPASSQVTIGLRVGSDPGSLFLLSPECELLDAVRLDSYGGELLAIVGRRLERTGESPGSDPLWGEPAESTAACQNAGESIP